jgi:hypothetical protein
VFTTMLPGKKIGFGDYVLNGFQRKQGEGWEIY